MSGVPGRALSLPARSIRADGDRQRDSFGHGAVVYALEPQVPARRAKEQRLCAPRIDSDMSGHDRRFACPACGYDALSEPAWTEAGGGSLEICPRCKIQFGYDDAARDPGRREAIWRTWVGSDAQEQVLRRRAASRHEGQVRRREEVDALVVRVARWAEKQADVRGLAVVGSWARGDADKDSDVDFVLLVDQPDAYLNDAAWIEQFGAMALIRTKRWGVLTERRLALPSGLEVDVGIAPVSWAAKTPIDAGTIDVGTRQVVSDGIRVVYDPDGVLANLVAAIQR